MKTVPLWPSQTAAANAECAFVARYDLLTDPQPETGAADSFCSEEGVEDIFEDRLSHGDARVGDGEGLSLCGLWASVLLRGFGAGAVHPRAMASMALATRLWRT